MSVTCQSSLENLEDLVSGASDSEQSSVFCSLDTEDFFREPNSKIICDLEKFLKPSGAIWKSFGDPPDRTSMKIFTLHGLVISNLYNDDSRRFTRSAGRPILVEVNLRDGSAQAPVLGEDL